MRFSLDKTTTRHWDFNFHSDVPRDASIQSRTVSGVGELKASFDVVNFMMFQSFQFDSIAFIRLATPFSFSFSLSKLFFFQSI